jgi:tyrosinase
MTHLTRRSVVAGVGGAGFALCLPQALRRANAQVSSVRYSATSPRGKAMLAQYARAVEKMSRMPKGDPRHWEFQWYTHWIPGPQSPWSAAVAKKNEMIASVYAGKPPTDPNRRLAEAMWTTCQPHGGNPGDPNMFQRQFFLPWHRYYVYYFEQIIRAVLPDPTFTLPYWDYLGGPPETRAIPPEFRERASALYRANRNPGVNDGVPIDQGRQQLNANAFRETSYIVNPQSGIGFCPQLEGNPHGTVHVDTGDGTNMGSVPTAAGDPIFWLHHCNIDRLWESWNRLPNRPNPKWPDRNFVFANGGGGRVEAPVAGADRVALLRYQYDNYFVPPGILEAEVMASAPLAAPLDAATPVEVVAAGTGPLTLGRAPTRVALAQPAEVLESTRSAVPLALPANQRNLYLVLGGIELQGDPGTTGYEVYLDLPEGAKAASDDPHYVGTLNFFGVPASHDHQAENDHDVAFNITGVLQKLQQNRSLSEQPTVTLTPVGEGGRDAKPVVREVSIVAA